MNREELRSIRLLQWPGNIDAAIALQHKLTAKVRIQHLKRDVVYIAGIDAAFIDDRVIGAACLYKLPGPVLIERVIAIKRCSVPYIPGFLSFREGPVLIEAIRKLSREPDLLLFDGQGIAHPRGLGIATHVGVVLDLPSVGCAKSRLVGEYTEPGKKKGDLSPLFLYGEVIGCVLRTRDRVRPVFVSPGHKVSFENSVDAVLHCTGKYRIPEPVRCADSYGAEIKRELGRKRTTFE